MGEHEVASPRPPNLGSPVAGVCVCETGEHGEAGGPPRTKRNAHSLEPVLCCFPQSGRPRQLQTRQGGGSAFPRSESSSQEAALAFTLHGASGVTSWAQRRKPKHAAGSALIRVPLQPGPAALQPGCSGVLYLCVQGSKNRTLENRLDSSASSRCCEKVPTSPR